MTRPPAGSPSRCAAALLRVGDDRVVAGRGAVLAGDQDLADASGDGRHWHGAGRGDGQQDLAGLVIEPLPQAGTSHVGQMIAGVHGVPRWTSADHGRAAAVGQRGLLGLVGQCQADRR
jgi:hypothetical protein